MLSIMIMISAYENETAYAALIVSHSYCSSSHHLLILWIYGASLLWCRYLWTSHSPVLMFLWSSKFYWYDIILIFIYTYMYIDIYWYISNIYIYKYKYIYIYIHININIYILNYYIILYYIILYYIYYIILYYIILYYIISYYIISYYILYICTYVDV